MYIVAIDRKTYVTKQGYVEGGEIVDADVIENERAFREKYPTMLIQRRKQLLFQPRGWEWQREEVSGED